MAHAPKGSKFSCWACSLSESFCDLNPEGLLCIGLQTIEALLDSGSKVTQKPASTPSKKKMTYMRMLMYTMAIPKVSNEDQQASENKSGVTIVLSARYPFSMHFGAFLKVHPSLQLQPPSKFLLFSLVGIK